MNVSPEWLEALSVLGATALAGIALKGQWEESKARRASSDATISVDAYHARDLVQNQLDSFLHVQALVKREGLGEDSPPGWERVQLPKPMPEVLHRLERALTHAPHASPGIAGALREGYINYRIATRSDTGLRKRLPEERAADLNSSIVALESCVGRLTAAIEPALRKCCEGSRG